ncbi:phytoene/squalene synthase family protein [Inquilinus sp. CAU 1745]|uniref:phytoene/squalene synthase family protein n=1 Tax=Inquilinus sp. CAU 1745 TaxID=3140369 RepID=UPI00325A57EA
MAARSTPETDSLSPCGRIARDLDRDRYLTAVIAPPEIREALFALYAFNVEVAKTREMVSEPMMGQIRLQWWRDSIDGIYEGNERRHEVVTPLGEAVRRHGLDRDGFLRIIDSRERDLADAPPTTLAELERYADDSAGTLLLQALRIAAPGSPDEAEKAARGIGAAWALIGIARAVPFLAQSRSTLLPDDLVAEARVDKGLLWELKPHPGLFRAVEILCAKASERLRAARAVRRDIPKPALPVLRSTAILDSHLRVLRRAGHNPFDARVVLGSPLRQWRLMVYALSGRY